MLSSSFIRNIIFEIVADIEIGPESSDETVPLSIVLNKGVGCVFLVTLSRRDESSGTLLVTTNMFLCHQMPSLLCSLVIIALLAFGYFKTYELQITKDQDHILHSRTEGQIIELKHSTFRPNHILYTQF